jgi:hypothetical protein
MKPGDGACVASRDETTGAARAPRSVDGFSTAVRVASGSRQRMDRSRARADLMAPKLLDGGADRG